MKKFSKLLTLVLVIVMAFTVLALSACSKDETTTPEARVVRISTTTSVNDSGLMAYLQPYFTKDTGYEWEISSAGTGAALNAARYGNADAVLVHSKSSEETFVSEGYGVKVDGYDTERVSLFYNYFILVGPSADPAGVKAIATDSDDTTTVKTAFAAIASNASLFVSRGDQSGTHNKEWTLWPESVGLTNNKVEDIPAAILNSTANPNGWYISAGAGMGACLTMANEKSAYCLTDKATFLSYKNNAEGDKLPNLELQYEEDSSMKNTYTIIAVNPDASFKDSVTGEAVADGTVSIDTVAAKVFIDWMAGEHAKALIAFYGTTLYGGSLFYLL